MIPNSKRVFYFEYLPHAVYTEIMGGRADVKLDRLEYAALPDANWATIQTAHAYQITAASGDLPAEFFADAVFLERCPNLLMVSSHGVGYDTIDVDACTAAGVAVLNQAGGNAEGVAEHVMAMMLCLSKRLIEVDRVMRREAGINRNTFIGNNIEGKTIGIVGLGHIGSRVSELCRGLFGMRVLAVDPYLSADEIAACGAEKTDLGSLFATADVVSINCPLTAETRGMVAAPLLARMKPTAFLVVTARGGIVDEAALAAALAEKRIAGAGLDVWEPEPPSLSHPLLAFDNVVSSPHTAGITHESRRNIATIAAEQVLATLDGERPPRLVNPEVWLRFKERYAAAFGQPLKI